MGVVFGREKMEQEVVQNTKRRKFDYMWIIVGLSFLMVFTVLGFCSSSKGVYLDAITNSLGIDRALFSINDSIRYVTTAIVNVFFGFLILKMGVKVMVACGFIALMGSMTCYALADNIWVFYAGGFLLGLGLAWTTTTMIGYVVGKWCKKNRGTVMGFILASNGLGGAFAISILSPIIGDGTGASAFGYRTAYWIIVAILGVVGLLCVIFYREKPKSEDEVSGDTGAKKRRGRTWEGVEFKSAIKMPYFYTACICIFFTGFVLQGITGIANAHISDVISKDFANIMSTVHLIVLTCSKFLAGFFYDKKGLRFTVNMCSISAIVSLLALSFISSSTIGIVLAVVYSVVSSVALPLETIMLPIYAADLFGEKSFSKIMGIFVSVNVAGYALAAPATNLCYSLTGTYTIALIVSCVVMALVLIGIQFVISAGNKQRNLVTGELLNR